MPRFFIILMLPFSSVFSDITDLIDYYSIQYIRMDSDPYLSDYDLGRKDAYYDFLNQLWTEHALMMRSSQQDLSPTLVHISEDSKEMIFYRALQIDGALMRMKYDIMYSDIDDHTKEKLIAEIDQIWYMLGVLAPGKN